MRYLNKIIDTSGQKFFLTGNPSQNITMSLRFMPSQQAWIMDIESGDFVARGILVVNSPNLLNAFKGIIKFGIMVLPGRSQLDPFTSDCFATQDNNMYLLNADDLAAIEVGLDG